MNIGTDLEHLRRLYARESLSQEEGEAWVEDVSQLLHRVAPGRAEEFDQLTPYLFAGLSAQLIRPTWHRIGDVVRAAIADLERGVQSSDSGQTPSNPKSVFVVHGRNDKLRSGLFSFLRALGLEPIEFSQAIRDTGKAAPYIGEILDAAFQQAQAVIVLLSPDDEVRLTESLWTSNEPTGERTTQLQARPNVLFEAGMAFGSHADRTVLVQVGNVKPFSDVGGRHVIRLDDTPQKRKDLADRLELAGCPVDVSGRDWMTEGDFTVPRPNVTLGGAPETIFGSSSPRAEIGIRMGYLGAWSSEQIILENIGNGDASEINIKADGAPIDEHSCWVSGQTLPTKLRPGEELGVKIALAMGSPERSEIQVHWHDEDGSSRTVERAVQLI